MNPQSRALAIPWQAGQTCTCSDKPKMWKSLVQEVAVLYTPGKCSALQFFCNMLTLIQSIGCRLKVGTPQDASLKGM
jgi:hypothetical protein